MKVKIKKEELRKYANSEGILREREMPNTIEVEGEPMTNINYTRSKIKGQEPIVTNTDEEGREVEKLSCGKVHPECDVYHPQGNVVNKPHPIEPKCSLCGLIEGSEWVAQSDDKPQADRRGGPAGTRRGAGGAL